MSEASPEHYVTTIPGLELHRDPWLSKIFGKTALRAIAVDEKIDTEQLSVALSGRPLFASARVPVGNVRLASVLQDIGFRLVDTALTFECGSLPNGPIEGVRLARASDRSHVVRIAENAFKYSRFHLDPLISNGLADRIKSEWAANYFNGERGEAMFVAEDGPKVAGFVLLLRGQEGRMVIDLIAVDSRHARRGLARAMTTFASKHGLDKGDQPMSIRVGTQAANIPSVRLYEGLGFRLFEAHHVLHFHGRGDTEMRHIEDRAK